MLAERAIRHSGDQLEDGCCMRCYVFLPRQCHTVSIRFQIDTTARDQSSLYATATFAHICRDYPYAPNGRRSPVSCIKRKNRLRLAIVLMSHRPLSHLSCASSGLILRYFPGFVTLTGPLKSAA